MAQHFFKQIWSDEKSLTLTRWLVLIIGLVCVGVTISGPRLVTWLMHIHQFHSQGPALGATLLVLGYCCAALAFWMLYNLYVFLDRLQKGDVFVTGNVIALRRISWCCLLAGLICVPAGFVFSMISYVLLGFAALFMALIVRVIKNAFEQAVGMKDELDLTV